MASLVQLSGFGFRLLTALCLGLAIPKAVVGQNATQIFRVLRGMRLGILTCERNWRGWTGRISRQHTRHGALGVQQGRSV